MTLRLNGESKSFDEAELTLPALLGRLGWGQRPVLVEHNGKALHQGEQAETTVRDEDRLEIVHIVAGG